jgi:hypothetical protein
MADGADLIEDLYAEMTDARSTLTYSGETVSEAVCTGLSRTRSSNEQGLLEDIAGLVRYKAADEPAAWNGDAIIGKVAAVAIAGGEAQTVKVLGRHVSAGAVRLDVENQHQ